MYKSAYAYQETDSRGWEPGHNRMTSTDTGARIFFNPDSSKKGPLVSDDPFTGSNFFNPASSPPPRHTRLKLYPFRVVW